MGKLASAIKELRNTPTKVVMERLYRAGYRETDISDNSTSALQIEDDDKSYIFKTNKVKLKIDGINDTEFSKNSECGVAA